MKSGRLEYCNSMEFLEELNGNVAALATLKEVQSISRHQLITKFDTNIVLKHPFTLIFGQFPGTGRCGQFSQNNYEKSIL
jgi:hypothetical protein